MTHLSAIPLLSTERLNLRAPEARDFEATVTFFASKEYSWGFGGPLDRTETWRWFASNLGHFALKGVGFWYVDTKTEAGPTTVGMVGLWEPEGWNEMELGWVIFKDHEGKGYGYEAASAVRDYAYNTLNFGALCSNIMPGNEASVSLATKLGARFESHWESPTYGAEHVYRHPSKEELCA